MTKTLGQVAYEAWHGELLGVDRPEEWSKEDKGRVMRWQAAAEAVVAAYVDLEAPSVDSCEALDAVIDAAKAYCETSFGADVRAHSDLVHAVEALEEVERG